LARIQAIGYSFEESLPAGNNRRNSEVFERRSIGLIYIKWSEKCDLEGIVLC